MAATDENLRGDRPVPVSPAAPQGLTAPPLVSVVIPHFNDLQNLDLCLDLLLRQDFDGGPVEIIVADNGSDAGLDAVARVVRNRARLITAEERGAGPARNAGVEQARGNLLAFIDSDCRPAVSWLREGLTALSSHDVIGGAISVSTREADRMTAAEAFERVFAFRNSAYVRSKNFTVTASMFMTRATFDAVGGFRNHVPEDIEWCDRAREKGFSLGFAPDCHLSHPARRDWNELKRKWRRLTREAYALARERGVSRAAWLGRAWMVLFSIVPHLGVVAVTPTLSRPMDRLNAAGMLVSIRTFRWAEAHRLAFGGQ